MICYLPEPIGGGRMRSRVTMTQTCFLTQGISIPTCHLTMCILKEYLIEELWIYSSLLIIWEGNSRA